MALYSAPQTSTSNDSLHLLTQVEIFIDNIYGYISCQLFSAPALLDQMSLYARLTSNSFIHCFFEGNLLDTKCGNTTVYLVCKISNAGQVFNVFKYKSKLIDKHDGLVFDLMSMSFYSGWANMEPFRYAWKFVTFCIAFIGFHSYYITEHLIGQTFVKYC